MKPKNVCNPEPSSDLRPDSSQRRQQAETETVRNKKQPVIKSVVTWTLKHSVCAHFPPNFHPCPGIVWLDVGKLSTRRLDKFQLYLWRLNSIFQQNVGTFFSLTLGNITADFSQDVWKIFDWMTNFIFSCFWLHVLMFSRHAYGGFPEVFWGFVRTIF